MNTEKRKLDQFIKRSRNEKAVERVTPSLQHGLTQEQVNERVSSGLTNDYVKNASKSAWQILIQNTCTLFNLINLLLFAALLIVGSYKNMLFMGVVLSNLLIGTIQELRAKRAVDRLSMLSTSNARVIREGRELSVPINAVVADDIVLYKQGDQIITDGVILRGDCEVNESFLTGESLPQKKVLGDTVLSGSFVTEGVCAVHATRVGREAYLNTIVSGAKKLKFAASEIMDSLKYIIRIISIAIFPIGAVLVLRQVNLNAVSINEAVVSVVAALIGMIPEGLMLLTSTVLAVGTLRLTRKGVLTRELYCIESLARIDTLCLDKTGTLTEGNLEHDGTILLGDTTPSSAEFALNTLTHALKTNNATFDAVYSEYHNENSGYAAALQVYEFSGRTKWSAVSADDGTTYIMGAAEFMLKQIPEWLKRELSAHSEKNRVILLARTHGDITHSSDGVPLLPDDIEPMALILLIDKIRDTAFETLRYFKNEQVTIKLISGDSLITVREMAGRAGVENYKRAIDVSTLKTREELIQAANEYTVFARVTPNEKEVLIEAMRSAGHKVAMTGDGVNDVLALRAADCSIAMASGTDAAKSVSQFVLTNSDFSTLPGVVAEGRRCINNIQGSASLFLNKTVYAVLLSVIFMILPMQYPFEPIQLSLISGLWIGIPSFILALQPNHDPIRGSFIKNVIIKALPGGLSIALGILAASVFAMTGVLPGNMLSTVCVLMTGVISMAVLVFASRPFNILRSALLFFMALGFVIAVMVFPSFFSLVPLNTVMFFVVLPYLAMALLIYLGLVFVFKKLIKI